MSTPKWNPKVRWYDYGIAVLAADFLFSNFIIMVTAEQWWMQIAAALALCFIWDAWDTWYCKKFRMKIEFEKFCKEIDKEILRRRDQKNNIDK